MAIDIQIGGVALQTEIEVSQPCVAGLSLQTEIGIPDIQIAGVSLQVEILEAEPGLDYEVFEGQYLKVYIDDALEFTGIISNVDKSLPNEASDKCYLDTSVTSLKNIPARRTVRVDYDIGDLTDDIVKDMVDTFLFQEGIERGTIKPGIGLAEEWKDDCITIYDVLDQCASKTGFQWFIDKDMKLHFFQDEDLIAESSHALVDDNEFTDYRSVRVNGTIDGYINKVFMVGGNDQHGNQIFSVRGDIAKQNFMQEICCGTGVYGFVNRDGANTETTYDVAEVDTTTTNIKITGHGLIVGDFIWNKTRGAYTYVTEVVDANNVTVETVASQTDGDTIVYYPSANKISANTIKRHGTLPKTITFETYETDFEPGTKLNIALSRLGITDSYWNIEEVTLIDSGVQYFRNVVTAVLRDNNDFSTQKRFDSKDFLKGF
jgi:hypothetical protein